MLHVAAKSINCPTKEVALLLVPSVWRIHNATNDEEWFDDEE